MSLPDGRAGTDFGVKAGWQGACPWTTQRLHGPISDLLDAAEPPPDSPRRARLHIVDHPGLVLGSTQGLETADHQRAEAAGAEVVRRRSGGGAVLLLPERQVWVDFFIPAADPLWSDDVGQAALWVGELWSAVIEPFVSEPVSVHSGRLVADRWGRLVCFAGAGPGEVFVGGRKVVGISQRRNRNRARIQSTARLKHSAAAEGAESGGRSLDELELLNVTAADRVAGRAVMLSRVGSIPATETDLADALLRELQDPR